jgi:hypothetical protein
VRVVLVILEPALAFCRTRTCRYTPGWMVSNGCSVPFKIPDFYILSPSHQSLDAYINI